MKTRKLSRYVEETININVEKKPVLKKISTVEKESFFFRKLEVF